MSEEKKIKVVLLEPGKLARTAEIGTSIEDLQNAVDGLIEPFYPLEEQVCIVCNDEGKINGTVLFQWTYILPHCRNGGMQISDGAGFDLCRSE